MSNSLNVTLAHAITFLTQPLLFAYPATTIIRLQLILEANLTAYYAPSWTVKDPSRGSGRRCMTLSPHYLPPRTIFNACVAAQVQWQDWIRMLGGKEFDFFVDPGRVAVRQGKKNIAPIVTVWSEEAAAAMAAAAAPIRAPIGPNTTAPFQRRPRLSVNVESVIMKDTKTIAQQLIESETHDENELFAMLADEIAVPTWTTPIIDNFPTSAVQPTWLTPLSEGFPSSAVSLRTESPFSDSASSSSGSLSSRSSSRSGFSDCSSNITSPATSNSSPTELRKPTITITSPSSQTSKPFKMGPSRREKARSTVIIDHSPREVTAYDGGRVGVLSGGVVLGVANPNKPKSQPKTSRQASSWRATRA